MKFATGLLIGVMAAGFCFSLAEGGQNESAALLVHAGGLVTGKTNCTSLIKSSCGDLNPNGTFDPASAYAVGVYVGRDIGGQGVAMTGIDFGVVHSNVLVTAWKHCGLLETGTETPAWPASGSGNSVVWGEPVTGNVVLIGYFTVYTYSGGTMTMGVHPTYGETRTVDPLSNFDTLKYPAVAALAGQGGGSNPDCTVPVRQTSWGQIKSLYQN